MDKPNQLMKLWKRIEIENCHQKKPGTQNDKKNQKLEFPIDAPAHCTIYDYGRQYYTEENHIKHLSLMKTSDLC